MILVPVSTLLRHSMDVAVRGSLMSQGTSLMPPRRDRSGGTLNFLCGAVRAGSFILSLCVSFLSVK